MAIDLSLYNQKRKEENQSQAKRDWTEDLSGLLSKEIKLFGSSFGDKKKVRFYSELSILLTSGIDMRTALEMLEEEQEKKDDRQLMGEIKQSMVEGKNLSEATFASGKFSEYEFYSMKIGEESGRMTEVLQSLTKYYDDKLEQRRQIINALSYPLIVISASVCVIVFMMRFVVPMFAELFRQFKGDLPLITKVMLRISGGMSTYGAIVLFSVIAVIGTLYSQRKAIWYRKFFSSLVLHLPVFGAMVKKVYLARFCQSMNLLLSAQTPLNSAIALVKKMVGFYPIEQSLDAVNEDLTRGAKLHESLGKFKVYERRMISLLRVAEEVKQMDVMFGRLAQQYGAEVDHQTKLLGNIIQPILLLLLGLVVGFIVLAMYMPLFQLSNIMQ